MPANERITVAHTLDLTRQPAVTDPQKKRLAAVAALPDERIDYSDAPHLPDAAWVRVAELPGLPTLKQQNTLRLDADVLEFFQLSGSGCQERINAVLRAYVAAHKALEESLEK